MGCGPSREELARIAALEEERDRLRKQEQQRIDFISSTPFLLCFSSAEIEEFAAAFTLFSFKAGEILCKQGDAAQHLYIIGDGTVDIHVLNAKRKSILRLHEDENDAINANDIALDINDVADSGSESPAASELKAKHPSLPNSSYLCSKYPGDFFGESAVLEASSTRTASVVAVENGEGLQITKEAFEKYIETHPMHKERILHTLGQRMDQHLSSLPFLSRVPHSKISLFSSLFHYVPLRAGQPLFEEGSSGQAMYVVYQGKVRAHVFDKARNENINLSEIGPGSYFGEISMLVDIPRTASITAVEDCLLLELRKKDCQNMLRLAPELRDGFDQLMKERTAEHFRRYNIPFFTSIPADHYSYLAQLCSIDHYSPNSVIFTEGEPGEAFHIIAYGDVSVRAKKGDNDIELCRMGPGKYFGEIALVRPINRTATVVTVSRVVLLSITKDKFNEFFQLCPEALSDFHVKLARYDIELNKLIYHPLGRDYFTRYLKQEFSEENIKFWMEAKSYKEIPEDNADKRVEMGREIWNQFVKPGAAEQVNLNSSNLKFVREHVENNQFPPNLFQSCMDEILALMSTDSFKRFKQGDLFQEFLKASESYQSVEANKLNRSASLQE